MDTLHDTLLQLEAEHQRAFARIAAPAAVRSRARRARRTRQAVVSGASVAAVGAVALAGGRIWGPESFVPASWAPAPSPLAADPQGNGHARLALPVPPVPQLPDNYPSGACLGPAPEPTEGAGHVTATLDSAAWADVTAERFTTGYGSEGSAMSTGVLARVTLRTTSGAPASVQVSDPLVVLVRDDVVVGGFNSSGVLRDVEARTSDGMVIISTTRAIVRLSADSPTAQVTGFAQSSWGCLADADYTIREAASDIRWAGMPEGDYTAYWIARVVADDQAAAIAHLADEGVDVDDPPADLGTPLRTYDGTVVSVVDVNFPAAYQQDQFDEIVVSSPLALTLRDSSGW